MKLWLVEQRRRFDLGAFTSYVFDSVWEEEQDADSRIKELIELDGYEDDDKYEPKYLKREIKTNVGGQTLG